MIGKQNCCMVVESDPKERSELVDCVKAHGFKPVECAGLFVCEECLIEPDTVIFGENFKPCEFEENLSSLELLVREAQIPVLAPQSQKEYLLTRFDEIHVYPNKETLASMVLAYVLNHSERRLIRSDMIKAVEGILHLEEGEFTFHCIEEAQALASLLSSLAPHKKILRLGLTELFVNSVEHGNLGISSEEKIMMREKGTWRKEVDKRLFSEEFKDKRVRLSYKKQDDMITLYVEDEGKGFDWQRMLERNPKDPLIGKSGRGLIIARKSGFDHLTYLGKGNAFECRFSLQEKES